MASKKTTRATTSTVTAANVTATAPSLNYTYDNSVWVLNDPVCMVKKVRLFFTGESREFEILFITG